MPQVGMPSPYEYALISKLSYVNKHDLDHLSVKDNNINHYDFLTKKSWRLLDEVVDHDYYADIWINKNTKQIVIAHRGSQNATSWITDYESVVQGKPGTFVHLAINTLNNEKVLELRNQGYRLSTTGHSLGGFLAQICVFWSQRREMELTYYPDMSAMVFDSPGAVDFLKTLLSNLESEKDSIDIGRLNIHNFCGMPTIVSTYGTQTGTIWHLAAAENVKFAFVLDHTMTNILEGFNSETGQPTQFRQMIDWPQADYNGYADFKQLVQTTATAVIRAPFDMLNYIWKNYVKRDKTNTWYDQIFTNEQGQVRAFLATARDARNHPSLELLEEQISLAIHAHYVSYSIEDRSRIGMNIQHFDKGIQIFLSDWFVAKQFGFEKLGLDNKLKEIFDAQQFNLLNQFFIEKNGNRTEIVLLPSYEGSIFDFQRNLLQILSNKELPSIYSIIGNTIEALRKNIERLDAKQHKELEEIQNKVRDLEDAQKIVKYSRLISVRSAVAKVPGSTALRFLNKIDYSSERNKELISIFENAKPGDAVYIDSAMAETPGSTAVVFSPGETSERIAELFQSMGLFSTNKKINQDNRAVNMEAVNPEYKKK